MAARALVLDLDGTLWDSYPWLARVVADGDEDAEVAAAAALRDRVPAARVLRDAGVTASAFKSVCAGARDLEPYPGVRETLDELARRGIPLAVVTNLPAWIARPMLDCLGLRGFFGSVVDYGRTRQHKPNPAPITASLADISVEAADDVWYVGDTDSDAEAASRAGIAFAWASYGYGPTKPAGAASVLDAFAEVLDL